MKLVELYEMGRKYWDRSYSSNGGVLQSLKIEELKQALRLATQAVELLDYIYANADEYDPDVTTVGTAEALEMQKKYLNCAAVWIRIELNRRGETVAVKLFLSWANRHSTKKGREMISMELKIVTQNVMEQPKTSAIQHGFKAGDKIIASARISIKELDPSCDLDIVLARIGELGNVESVNDTHIKVRFPKMGVQSDIPHAVAVAKLVIRETVKPSPTPKQVRQPKDNTFKAGDDTIVRGKVR